MRKYLLVLCASVLLISAAPEKLPQDPSEQVALALFEGSNAILSRKVDRKTLRHAAQSLAFLGARPADGQETDLAVEWRTLSAVRGTEPVYRGRILGPAYRSGMVAPGAAINSEQLFLAGQLASLSVAPAKGAKLGLTVSNSQGAAICSAAVQEPTATCRWTPAYSERVKISINNFGTTTAKYFLVVN
jgi:hypothetical protein